MPPLVYRRLVEIGALAISDLVRFAGSDRRSDARRALVLLVDDGVGDLAAEAAAALRALHLRASSI